MSVIAHMDIGIRQLKPNADLGAPNAKKGGSSWTVRFITYSAADAAASQGSLAALALKTELERKKTCDVFIEVFALPA